MPRPKQALAPLDLLPGPSASGTTPRLPKRPFRKNSPAPNSLPDPSLSGLLTLLVTVAGSSSVDGRPLDSEIPPDFLCPRLHAHPSAQPSSSQAPPTLYWVPCDASEAATYSDSSFPPLAVDFSARHPKKRSRRSVNIADKYEQFSDGRWRKVDSWELYGSSSCAVSQCMDATPTEIPVQDDQITPSTGAGSAPTSTSTSSTGPSLPHGWEGSKAGDDMTGIILGLSLSLALSLIAFMIGIVWWRRKRRKQETDAEKPPSTIDTASTQLSEEAQRVLSKQRKWQRASAKWLAGVKHSARRRRRFGATASTRPSDTDLLTGMATAIQASTSGVSLTRTQTTTNHDSAYTTPSASVRRVPPRSRSLSIASSDGNANHSSGANPLSPLSPHPPAYMPDPADNSRSHRQTYFVTSPDSRPSEVRPSVDLSADPSSPCPYEPPIHSAHVATDDKAILAQMARMASAPPPGDEPSPVTASEGSSEVHPSVPILEVDSFEALPPEHGTRAASASFVTHDTFCSAKQVAPSSYPSRHVAADHDMDLEVPSYAEAALRHRSPVLPLPPEKVPLTGPTFYEYPNEFEDDVASTDPPPGPSSPPFEELSAPPFAFEDGPDGAHMMVPSAPPVEVEDEPTHIGEFLPSAPPFDVNDSLPTIDPHSPPVSPDLESSTPMTGDHRPVNVDARPGAVSSGRGAEYGSSASPPQYLP